MWSRFFENDKVYRLMKDGTFEGEEHGDNPEWRFDEFYMAMDEAEMFCEQRTFVLRVEETIKYNRTYQVIKIDQV